MVLAMSSSIQAKSLLDVLIDKAVNQNTSQVHSETLESVEQGLPNGYIYATPNDAGEIGSLNPDIAEDGVTVATTKLSRDLNNDGIADTVALAVTKIHDVLFLYSNISGLQPKIEPIFNEIGEYLSMYDFSIKDRGNGQIKISLVYKMGGETNVLATYDKALNDFKVDHYSVVHEIECARPTVVSLDFANGLLNKERQSQVSCTKPIESKIKKEHKAVQSPSMFLSDGINAIAKYVSSISPN
ncbi:hypothetical protein DFR44_1314 [Hydromonas duriensis]|uniref:Uncharacterized protein n=2 Tax=Hydromonas duriensis TaxID=1527608 RepID=A0A4R6Y4R1_9BURK|nr:hypothetical protein DFR44_1314 [Hydromonas duriensis]